MNLLEALRLKNKTVRMALVGAGGKTSTLFRLGKELALINNPKSKQVWLSATTHLSIDQLAYADKHIEIVYPSDFDNYLMKPDFGVILFTGKPVEDGRTAGVTLAVFNEMLHIANANDIPIIIEADGARRLPLKSPADHEPVIPPWIEQVVVIAGLSALGKPMTGEWVHRPEIFSELSGLSLGEILTSEAMVSVLGHPNGGLKGIPKHARRILLLNQAGTPELQAAGQMIASRLQHVYDSIILADLQPPVGEGKISAVFEPVAGVVLAAGQSLRMGKPKQLLPWKNHPLVYHAAHKGVISGLNPVLVVVGNVGDEVANQVKDLPVRIVKNPYWQDGQSTSVIAAIQALPENVGAVIFLMADQPLIPVDLIRSLVATHAVSLAPIIAPLINGRRSSPVIFDRELFSDLSKLSGDIGGRALFSHYPVKWLEWYGKNIELDIDNERDYQRLISLDKKASQQD